MRRIMECRTEASLPAAAAAAAVVSAGTSLSFFAEGRDRLAEFQ